MLDQPDVALPPRFLSPAQLLVLAELPPLRDSLLSLVLPALLVLLDSLDEVPLLLASLASSLLLLVSPVLLASLALRVSLLEVLLPLDSTPLLDDEKLKAGSNFCDTHAKSNLVQYDIPGYKGRNKISAAVREWEIWNIFARNHCYDQGWRLVMLKMTSGL